MKYILLGLTTLMLLSGCSQKEMSDTGSGIGNDISDFGDKLFKQR